MSERTRRTFAYAASDKVARRALKVRAEQVRKGKVETVMVLQKLERP